MSINKFKEFLNSSIQWISNRSQNKQDQGQIINNNKFQSDNKIQQNLHDKPTFSFKQDQNQPRHQNQTSFKANDTLQNIQQSKVLEQSNNSKINTDILDNVNNLIKHHQIKNQLQLKKQQQQLQLQQQNNSVSSMALNANKHNNYNFNKPNDIINNQQVTNNISTPSFQPQITQSSYSVQQQYIQDSQNNNMNSAMPKCYLQSNQKIISLFEQQQNNQYAPIECLHNLKFDTETKLNIMGNKLAIAVQQTSDKADSQAQMHKLKPFCIEQEKQMCNQMNDIKLKFQLQENANSNYLVQNNNLQLQPESELTTELTKTKPNDSSQAQIAQKFIEAADSLVNMDLTTVFQKSLWISKESDEISKLMEQELVISQKRQQEKELLLRQQDPLEMQQLQLYVKFVTNFLMTKSGLRRRCFPDISYANFKKVRAIWHQNDGLEQEVVRHPHIPEKLSYRTLQTLKRETWLNDEVINAYLKLILKQEEVRRGADSSPVRIMNTFFFPEMKSAYTSKNYQKILRIAKRQKLDSTAKSIFVPINQNNNHWLFVEINLHCKQIWYYNSLRQGNFTELLDIFHQFAKELAKQNDVASPEIEFTYLVADSFPKQLNGTDCGMFVLKGIQYRLAEEPFFEQEDIPFYRLLACIELIQGHITSDNM